jgi:alcohol dehydrogenase class IV
MNPVMQFQMCGRLIFGNGSLAELPAAVKRLGGLKVLIVTDPGLVKAGLLARVAEVLSAAGIVHTTYDRVEPDPRMGVVDDCLKFARGARADVLVGLGGGSSLDVTKVVAILLAHNCEIADLIGIDKISQAGKPTILIPTTAGTGSEVTPIAVLSDEKEHLKKGIVSEHLYPRIALVDPTLAAGLPPHITAFTGMDALTHVIEAYTSKFAQPMVDMFALEAIRLIGSNLRRAVSSGHDVQARYSMALASLYGGLCLGPVNTAAVHALAYPLGGTYNVPHGVANALLLPYVMEFNLISDLGKFARIAEALGENLTGLSARDAADRAVIAVSCLSSDIGIVSRMRDLNIPENALDEMSAAAMKVTRLLNNNPRTVTLKDVRAIYGKAF